MATYYGVNDQGQNYRKTEFEGGGSVTYVYTDEEVRAYQDEMARREEEARRAEEDRAAEERERNNTPASTPAAQTTPTTPTSPTTKPSTPSTPSTPAATALSMSTATFARSVKGAGSLKESFSQSIDNLVKVLNGDKYAAMKKTIQSNWVGADATDFLNDIEKTRASLEKSLKALKTKFNAAIDADSKQFISFQAKNIK